MLKNVKIPDATVYRLTGSLTNGIKKTFEIVRSVLNSGEGYKIMITGSDRIDIFYLDAYPANHLPGDSRRTELYTDFSNGERAPALEKIIKQYSNVEVKTYMLDGGLRCCIIGAQNEALLNTIAGMIHIIFPEQFGLDKIGQDQIDMMKSIFLDDEKTFLSIVNKLDRQKRGDCFMQTAKNMSSFMHGGYSYHGLKKEIGNKMRTVNELQTKLDETIMSLKRLNAQMLQVQADVDGETVRDLYDFISGLDNCYIHYDNSMGEACIHVWETSEQLDRDEVEDFIRAHNLSEEIKTIIRGMCDGLKVKLYNRFRINTSCLPLYPESITWYMIRNTNYITNPHLGHYRCFGGHASYITNCLKDGDYEGLISYIVASVKNINPKDVLVFDRFLKDIEEFYNSKILILDGEDLTPAEYYERVKGAGNETNDND